MGALTYRDAMAYMIFRRADLDGRPIHLRQAEALADEVLSVCPRSLKRIAKRAYRSRTPRSP